MASLWMSAHPGLAWVLIPAGLLCSWLLAHRVAPEAAGSGIPQLIAVLKGEQADAMAARLLRPIIVPVKILGSCVCVAVGGVVGREGPTLHVAGSLFYGIYRRWPRFRHFSPRLDLPSMVLAGGAAGLAAAFNTPLGGIVFAVEELAKVHLSQVRTYIFHAVIIAGLLAQGVLGDYLYLERIHSGVGHLADLLLLALTAVVIGGLGGLFSKLLVKALDRRARLKFGGKFIFTLGCGLLLASFFFWRGPSALGSGKEVILGLLREPRQGGEWSLALVRLLGSFFTYGAGVIGGVFAPALATGASLGAWAASLFSSNYPQLFVLVGMVAFLSGVTQTPFTSCVLVLEMTDGHGVILPLMVAAICAQGGSKFVDPVSFYEHVSDRWLDSLKIIKARQ